MKIIKTTAILLLMCVFILNVSAQKQPDKPNTQDNNNSGKTSGMFTDDPDFKIYFFNQTPTKSESNVPTAVGDVAMISYMFEESGSVAYMVAKASYPEESVRSGNKDEMLEGAVNGFTGNLGLTISTKTDVKLGVHPGKYFKSSSATYYNATAAYLVKNTLYQIAILRADRAPTEKEINDFIFSFSLK